MWMAAIWVAQEYQHVFAATQRQASNGVLWLSFTKSPELSRLSSPAKHEQTWEGGGLTSRNNCSAVATRPADRDHTPLARIGANSQVSIQTLPTGGPSTVSRHAYYVDDTSGQSSKSESVGVWKSDSCESTSFTTC